jgi:hypothetical protein
MNKPKVIKTLLPALLLASFCLLLTASTATANPSGISINSCDSSGKTTEVYNVGDSICITGSGFAPLTTYDVYVVNHITWTDGLTIPARISGSVTTLTTDASGSFFAYAVWPNAQAGASDIVIDMNGDGIYHSTVDVLEDNHTTSEPFVAPEYPLYALLATVTCFAAFLMFKTTGGLKTNYLKRQH